MSKAPALPRIEPLHQDAMALAAARLDNLTKPRGSLGRLEELAIRLAGIQARPLPSIDRKLALVVAADHGIAAQGVSAYPQEVTGQMVANFLAGQAAISVLSRWLGCDLMVVDAGVREPIGDPRVVDLRLGPGTADFSRDRAMPREVAEEAVARGVELGRSGLEADAVACGEMGIANTTAASAAIAALLRLPAAVVTGAGTGVDGPALARKVKVIEAALAFHRPDATDPVDVLSRVGGFEIGVLSGVMLGAASMRRVVVVDGLISAAAALIAARLCPGVRDYLIAGHLSTEPGHALVLRDLELEPLLTLNMRLGEGTGAALALPLLEAACLLLSEMATFEEAGVSGREAGVEG